MAFDEGGYVLPKQDCCHVFALSNFNASSEDERFGLRLFPHESWLTACAQCGDGSESWYCLRCAEVFCSRYVRGHMREHWEISQSDAGKEKEKDSPELSHCLAVSLVDLSVWCFACNQYIKHQVFQQLLVRLEILKFGSSSLAHTLNLANPLPSTGFFYDELHGRHFPTTAQAIHGLEDPKRIQTAYEDVMEKNLLCLCYPIPPRRAGVEEVALVHTQALIHSLLESANDSTVSNTSPSVQPSRPLDIYVTPDTPDIALRACGGVVDLSLKVMKGELENGFALVRPPGHHCESNKQGGYCLINNVAVAAASVLRDYPTSKILIVDWDVHHGNGVQEIFYTNPNVFYQSVHLIEPEEGLFFADEGLPKFAGSGAGLGFNMNVALPHASTRYGDCDYLHVFEEVFIPAAERFTPDLILVCAGFDSASGDPLGKSRVTAQCFGYLTSRLMRLAKDGKIVLALEGGYNSRTVSECVVSCLSSLLKKNAENLETYIESLKGEQVQPQTLDAVKQCLEVHDNIK